MAARVILDDGTQYVYGAGLVAQIVSGTPSYFLSDGLGSTLAVVDGTGTLQQTYSYDVYGKATAGVSNHSTEYTFAGQQTDPSGLQYLRARYYDPSTGRFLSRDPLSAIDPAALNPYAYAGDDPASASDPSGLFFDPNLNLPGPAPSVDPSGGDTLLHNPCICGGDPNDPTSWQYTADESACDCRLPDHDAAMAAMAAVVAAGSAAADPSQSNPGEIVSARQPELTYSAGGPGPSPYQSSDHYFRAGNAGYYDFRASSVGSGRVQIVIDMTFTGNGVITDYWISVFFYNEDTGATGHINLFPPVFGPFSDHLVISEIIRVGSSRQLVIGVDEGFIVANGVDIFDSALVIPGNVTILVR